VPNNVEEDPVPLTNTSRARRNPMIAALVVALALLVPAGVAAAPTVPGRTIDLQILDVSDWHGQVDPISVFGVGDVGGGAVLKAYFDQARSDYRYNLTLTAGDDVGATPPLSNYFEDVPAILAERMMGIEVGTLGNHNFDFGLERLQSQIDLAGSPESSVPGTPFKYVSANLENRDDNISGVADYAIFRYGGVKVAVIGATNEEAPSLNFPGSMGTMVPTDSAAAVMAAKADARKKGAKVFIAITHKGVTTFSGGQPQGELIDFANAVSGFDVIFGDHTDIQFSGMVNGQYVVENRSKGLTFSKTVLTINRGTGDVQGMSHQFVTPLASGVTPDPAVQAMLQPYRDQLGPIFSTIVGDASVFIPRADSCGGSTGRLCESLIGNLITDAMRATYGTQIALMNSGGIRANLTCPTVDSPTDFCPSYTPPPYPITRGQVNTVLPFGNIGVRLTLSGTQLKAMLENAVFAAPAADGRFGQVSGLCFAFDIQQAPGSRVTGAILQAGDGTCTGAAVDFTAAGSYTFATNEFVAAGGDSYPILTGYVSFGFLDQDVSDWLSGAGTVSPVLQSRIVCTDSDPGNAPACPTPLP